LAMNPDRFESLSKEDQEALMSVSGEKLSQLAGKMWDDTDKAAYDEAIAAGNTIVTASDAVAQEFMERVAVIEDEWLEKAAGSGVDAKAALDELRQIAREYDQ